MSRRYATLPLDFFTSPVVKQLAEAPKVLYAYLHVNPATNLLGLYYLPRVLITAEAGLSKKVADKAWQALEDLGLVQYDDVNQIVYLPGFMNREAGGDLSPDDKRVTGAAKELKTLFRTPLVGVFLRDNPVIASKIDGASHGAFNGASHGPSDGASDAPSMPRSGSGSPSGAREERQRGGGTELGITPTHARTREGNPLRPAKVVAMGGGS